MKLNIPAGIFKVQHLKMLLWIGQLGKCEHSWEKKTYKAILKNIKEKNVTHGVWLTTYNLFLEIFRQIAIAEEANEAVIDWFEYKIRQVNGWIDGGKTHICFQLLNKKKEETDEC